MDVHSAVHELPACYGEALRAALAGLDDSDLAEALDVPPEAVRNVVLLALAKLNTLLDER